MKLKVCGLKYQENIREIALLEPDYMGFIFFESSKRFVGLDFEKECLSSISKNTKTVAVFVNSDVSHIQKICKHYQFDYVQLHGNETPEFCKEIQQLGIKIIKAFGIIEGFDFNSISPYKPHCEYFLFDTKGIDYGGNGITFDWSILNQYDNEKPFFLSGGLGLNNIEEALKLDSLNIHSLDVNSKFETNPGLKNMDLINQLVMKLA